MLVLGIIEMSRFHQEITLIEWLHKTIFTVITIVYIIVIQLLYNHASVLACLGILPEKQMKQVSK